jgi:hypothetical protein
MHYMAAIAPRLAVLSSFRKSPATSGATFQTLVLPSPAIPFSNFSDLFVTFYALIARF